ncbi:hypothetical protein OIU78_003888 [Salix suchowensis]|nr:hypothetical protein OIU78_003888 [Salix suchowensis]
MKEQIGMKNCGQQRLPDCERKRSQAKNQTKRTMGTVMKSKINFLFKTKKDPLEISKNLGKTKHENLSDTGREFKNERDRQGIAKKERKRGGYREGDVADFTKIDFIDMVVP